MHMTCFHFPLYSNTCTWLFSGFVCVCNFSTNESPLKFPVKSHKMLNLGKVWEKVNSRIVPWKTMQDGWSLYFRSIEQSFGSSSISSTYVHYLLQLPLTGQNWSFVLSMKLCKASDREMDGRSTIQIHKINKYRMWRPIWRTTSSTLFLN